MRKGATRPAVKKYLLANNDLTTVNAPAFRAAFRKAVDSGALTQSGPARFFATDATKASVRAAAKPKKAKKKPKKKPAKKKAKKKTTKKKTKKKTTKKKRK